MTLTACLQHAHSLLNAIGQALGYTHCTVIR